MPFPHPDHQDPYSSRPLDFDPWTDIGDGRTTGDMVAHPPADPWDIQGSPQPHNSAEDWFTTGIDHPPTPLESHETAPAVSLEMPDSWNQPGRGGESHFKPFTEARPLLSKALAADTCRTKVTAREVGGYYSQLFEDDVKSLSTKELAARSKELSQQVDAFAQKAGIEELPADFDTYVQDVRSGKPQIPIDQYLSLFSGYMDKFGVKVLTDWDTSTLKKPITADIKPAPELIDTKNTRSIIVGNMYNMQTISPAAFKKTHVNRIVMGYMPEREYAGMVTIHNPYGGKFSNNDVYVNLYDDSEGAHGTGVMDHEALGHKVNVLACGLFKLPMTIEGYDNSYLDSTDGAFEVLNGGVPYGKNTEQKYSNSQSAGPSLYNKSSDGQRISFVRSYGMGNYLEDNATLAELAGPSGGSLLYSLKAGDATPVALKLSISLARMHSLDPAAFDPYLDLTIARLKEQEVQAERNSRETQEVSELYAHASSVAESPRDTEAKVIAASKRYEKYFADRGKFD